MLTDKETSGGNAARSESIYASGASERREDSLNHRMGIRARNAVLGVLFAYALLTATNLGEFWPFSIYPMFSQAGNSWSRALVREVDPAGTPVIRGDWRVVPLDSLPGSPFATKPNGVDPIDLANFVSKTDEWSISRVQALQTMFFGSGTPDRSLLVFRVRGRLTTDDRVDVNAEPYVLITPDSTTLNPGLRP